MTTLVTLYLAIAGCLGALVATLATSFIEELRKKHVRNDLRYRWRIEPRALGFDLIQIALGLAALALIGIAAEMAATPGWPWVFIVCFVAGSALSFWALARK